MIFNVHMTLFCQPSRKVNYINQFVDRDNFQKLAKHSKLYAYWNVQKYWKTHLMNVRETVLCKEYNAIKRVKKILPSKRSATLKL